jgi:hypothetical protein
MTIMHGVPGSSTRYGRPLARPPPDWPGRAAAGAGGPSGRGPGERPLQAGGLQGCRPWWDTQAEVGQAEDEEGTVPRPAHAGRLRRRDHVRLRAGDRHWRRPLLVRPRAHAQLAAAAQDVLAQLKRHLTAGTGADGASRRAPNRPHRRGPCARSGIPTEGPVPTWTLPPGEMTDAAVDRLLRRRGERTALARPGGDMAAGRALLCRLRLRVPAGRAGAVAG